MKIFIHCAILAPITVKKIIHFFAEHAVSRNCMGILQRKRRFLFLGNIDFFIFPLDTAAF